MSNDNYALVFDDVTFSYEGTETALKKINLKIQAGETVAIVGANGSGKSTLMKLVTGLLSSGSGSVTVSGLEVASKNLKQIRKLVGYTFQDPDNQLFMPSVYEDVAFASKQQKVAKDQVEVIVDDALKQVGALHLKEKAPYKLSGGEKRLVTLATVLASEPEILMLDEPAVGLDPRARRQLIRLLRQRGETKIITTHDMDLALELCDRIIVLYDGEIKADDSPLRIFGNRQLLCENHLELPLRLQGCISRCKEQNTGFGLPVCEKENGHESIVL